VIVVFAVPLLDKIRVDDVAGAMPVHLLAGIWGTLAVPLANIDATLLAQIIGIGAFVSVSGLVYWLVLRFTIGLRPGLEHEMDGMDQTEIGLEAYLEFGAGSQRI
jgi:Amt family ammonium transporter